MEVDVKKFELTTYMTGWPCQLLMSVTPGQPLILERVPANATDGSAVLLKDVLGAAKGYVATEHTPLVDAALSEGRLLLAKVLTVYRPCHRWGRVYVWEELREVDTDISELEKFLDVVKAPEPVT